MHGFHFFTSDLFITFMPSAFCLHQGCCWPITLCQLRKGTHSTRYFSPFGWKIVMKIHSVMTGKGGCLTDGLPLSSAQSTSLHVASLTFTPAEKFLSTVIKSDDLSLVLLLFDLSVSCDIRNHPLLFATCYVGLKETGWSRIKDTSGILLKRLIGYSNSRKPQQGSSPSQTFTVIYPRRLLPGGFLLSFSRSPLVPVSCLQPVLVLCSGLGPFPLLLPWCLCQQGIHPLFLTFYTNLPTPIKFEETEGVHFHYRAANSGL